MKKVTFAATQMVCSDNVDQNLNKAEKLIRQAKEMGADVVLIQELFSYLYFCQVYDNKYFKLAKTEDDSPVVELFQRLAKELEIVIPATFFEKADNTYYNSVVMIDADGTRLGKYRKSHIPDDPGYYEKYYFAPGNTGFKVWDTKYCKIGVGICWDQWFPEAARCMCLQGAEVLLYPTAIGTAAVPPDEIDGSVCVKDAWQRVMLGHAVANAVPVIASNRVGKEYIGDTGIGFWGSSFISDVDGNLIEEMDKQSEGIIIHTIDLESDRTMYKKHLHFRDRRTDLYDSILK